MSCFNANEIGNSNENNEKKKKAEVVEIANGCFASKVMIFKAKELNRK